MWRKKNNHFKFPVDGKICIKLGQMKKELKLDLMQMMCHLIRHKLVFLAKHNVRTSPDPITNRMFGMWAIWMYAGALRERLPTITEKKFALTSLDTRLCCNRFGWGSSRSPKCIPKKIIIISPRANIVSSFLFSCAVSLYFCVDAF